MSSTKIWGAGGLQEIGARNQWVVEHNGKAFGVDAGQKIPHDMTRGQIREAMRRFGRLPDEYYPREEVLDGLDLEDVFITHGHRDHMGSLPRLLRRFPGARVITAPLTGEVIKMDAALEGRRPPQNMHILEHLQRLEIGEFGLTQFSVNHSIPDASGCLVEVGGCRTVFLGDHKLYPVGPGEIDRNYEIAKAVKGDKPIQVLVVDATNIYKPGFVIPEQVVADRLRSIWDAESGRIFSTTIGSNVPRYGPATDYALFQGRSVFVGGGGMRRFMGIAGIDQVQPLTSSQCGDIDGFAGKQILSPWPFTWPDNSVIWVTGSQAEPDSFLDSLAKRRFIVSSRPDDVFVQAQSVIPKPEIWARWASMMRVLSARFKTMYVPSDSPEFESLGAKIVRYDDLTASGHAYQDEIMRTIEHYWSPGMIVVFGHADLERREFAAEVARKHGVEVALIEEGECLEI